MPTKILMPSLSPTMVDGKLSKWLKKEGDVIKTGDIIAEIETDKATMEYESSVEGTLGKILVAEGSEGVAVNALIAVLLNKGETNADVDSFVKAQSANSTAPKTQTSAVEVKKEESKVPLPSVPSSASANTSSNAVPLVSSHATARSLIASTLNEWEKAPAVLFLYGSGDTRELGHHF